MVVTRWRSSMQDRRCTRRGRVGSAQVVAGHELHGLRQGGCAEGRMAAGAQPPPAPCSPPSSRAHHGDEGHEEELHARPRQHRQPRAVRRRAEHVAVHLRAVGPGERQVGARVGGWAPPASAAGGRQRAAAGAAPAAARRLAAAPAHQQPRGRAGARLTSFQPVSSCASSAVSSWLYLEMSRCSVRIMIMATMPLREQGARWARVEDEQSGSAS